VGRGHVVGNRRALGLSLGIGLACGRRSRCFFFGRMPRDCVLRVIPLSILFHWNGLKGVALGLFRRRDEIGFIAELFRGAGIARFSGPQFKL